MILLEPVCPLLVITHQLIMLPLRLWYYKDPKGLDKMRSPPEPDLPMMKQELEAVFSWRGVGFVGAPYM
jgi:hypothetical protein